MTGRKSRDKTEGRSDRPGPASVLSPDAADAPGDAARREAGSADGPGAVRRILHLSDLHFGRSRPELEEPLLRAIARIRPDLVVISGDFTQRARRAQFARARAFLDRIEQPTLCVPGNHDTPLDNLWLRFARPFSRYRRYIDRRLEPVWEDDSLVVVGVNTVNPYAWQQGKFSSHTLKRVCGAFEDSPGKLHVAVLHHPLEHGADVDKRLMRGAGRALSTLADCGADLVLSGHLHRAGTMPFSAAPGLLFVQAGTGLSTRMRGEQNNFNLIEGSAGQLRITTWQAGTRRDGEDGFAPVAASFYRRGGQDWERPLPRDEALPGERPLARAVDWQRMEGG